MHRVLKELANNVCEFFVCLKQVFFQEHYEVTVGHGLSRELPHPVVLPIIVQVDEINLSKVEPLVDDDIDDII